jgi:hypothetical protein
MNLEDKNELYKLVAKLAAENIDLKDQLALEKQTSNYYIDLWGTAQKKLDELTAIKSPEVA